MARVPYLAADISEPRDIVDALRARRGGALARIDRLLLHSPEFAAGWNVFIGTVRNRLSLPPRLRELAIVSVCTLMNAEYEVVSHSPQFLDAGGSQRQLDAMDDIQSAARNGELFDDTERAVLQLSLEMTKSIDVTDSTFASALAALGSPKRVIELVAVIATYNMTNRFLMALDFEV